MKAPEQRSRTPLGKACLLGCLVMAAAVLAAAPELTVHQKNQEFSVRNLVVKPGDRITFVNSDNVTHNIYSDSKGFEFEIELQPPGRADTVQFSRPGIAEVRCAIHPNMRLSVEVKK